MGRILMKSLNSRKRNLRELAVWGSAENSFSSATWPGEPEGQGGQGFWRGQCRWARRLARRMPEVRRTQRFIAGGQDVWRVMR